MSQQINKITKLPVLYNLTTFIQLIIIIVKYYSYQRSSSSYIIQHMQLKNIINNPQIGKSQCQNSKKIIHQLTNEGCKCTLCQKVILQENNIIKHVQYQDLESQCNRGHKQEYFNNFLQEFYYIDKINRKIRIILPQMCIFQKGLPVCLLTKKKDILPLKMLKNKQKMNAFQIQNFFMQGYIYHNNLKQNEQIMKNHKVKTLKKQYYKFDEYLKNECIVLVKFTNGSCQMMTPIELNNLFKSKQKNTRNSIRDITTMVCSENYNQIRCHIDLKQLERDPLLERAKNEVKMINQNIKPKDFMFIPQREERKFEQNLKKQDQRKFLQYLALKMLLIYSLKTDILLSKCLFKFMKDQKDNFYLVDLQSYHKESAAKLWGQFQKKRQQSPKKTIKRRPVSSPEKLQSRKIKTQENQQTIQQQMKKFIIDIKQQDQTFLRHNFCQVRENQEVIKKIQSRIKSNSTFKLEPIKVSNSYRNRRLVSSIVSQNQPKLPIKRFI